MNAVPLIPPDRYIDSGAVVSGPAALVMSRVLKSPNVVTVLHRLPPWLDVYRDEITATVNAVHQAAAAWESRPVAPEREDATVVGADTAESAPEWTTQRAAAFLRLSQRRVQELAEELGGRRVGRHWLLEEAAVRREHEKRKRVA